MLARFTLIATMAAALLSPRTSLAQQPSSAPQAGPRFELTVSAMQRLAAHDRATADSVLTAMQQRNSVGRPMALMLVGGAAIILGAVIGDAPGALFMIGGAFAFLYGLYQYLK